VAGGKERSREQARSVEGSEKVKGPQGGQGTR
jgi:hypothetical protein